MAASAYAFVQCAGLLMAGTACMLLVVAVLLLIVPGLPVNDPWSLALNGFFGVSLAAPLWGGWLTGGE